MSSSRRMSDATWDPRVASPEQIRSIRPLSFQGLQFPVPLHFPDCYFCEVKGIRSSANAFENSHQFITLRGYGCRVSPVYRMQCDGHIWRVLWRGRHRAGKSITTQPKGDNLDLLARNPAVPRIPTTSTMSTVRVVSWRSYGLSRSGREGT